MRAVRTAITVLLAMTLGGCVSPGRPAVPAAVTRKASSAQRSSDRAKRFAEAAMSQVGKTVRYDASYVELAYPGGDVPLERGVCTDVVVRAQRALGVDLQVEVHEDMTRAFDAYPHLWDLAAPDPNIDHRRVPNLQTYYTRQRKAWPVTDDGADYWPGDVVAWDVYGRAHIGVVSTRLSADGSRYLIAHNIGAGVRITDDLFTYRITGHYRPF